jgi:methionyl-tRNA formyltransferase
MRALFFGTPEIAVPSLRALRDIADVVGVVCQPDKPVGRSQELSAPPVKLAALELGLEVHQPVKVRVPEFAAWVRDRGADVALVLAYGRILPKAVLDAPRRGCMNLHASILPRYRGAAPITWAIVRGEKETGFSLMQMDEGLDTGPVYAVRALPIGPDETAGELTSRMAILASEMVRRELPDAVEGKPSPTAQDAERATLAPILAKEDGRIDWTKPSAAVHDHVRGMHPWPGAFTTVRGKLFKVLRTERTDGPARADTPPGTVIVDGKKRILVACGDGALSVARGQLEGKKALDAAELIGGRALVEGDRLGTSVA